MAEGRTAVNWIIRKAASGLRPGGRFVFSDDIGGDGDVVTVESAASMFGTVEVRTEELDFTLNLVAGTLVTLNAEKGKTMTRIHWNTEELTELLSEEVGVENSGSWDPIADERGFRGLTLKKFIMHNDRCTLKFTNGHKEYIYHPEPADPSRAPDGDLWGISTLGWCPRKKGEGNRESIRNPFPFSLSPGPESFPSPAGPAGVRTLVDVPFPMYYHWDPHP